MDWFTWKEGNDRRRCESVERPRAALSSVRSTLPRLIDDWAVARLWNVTPCLARSGDPRRLCLLHFSQSFFRRNSERGTCFEVRDVRDISVVFFAEEDIDVVVLHATTPSGLRRMSRNSRAMPMQMAESATLKAGQ